MSAEWTKTTLGEFIRLQRGHDLTDSERKPGDIPVFGSAGQNGCHDKSLASGPGIVIGRSGASFGQVHYSPVNYWPHNTTLYVTDFLGNDPQFAYYLLKSIDFTQYNSGSAQPSLNRNFIYHVPIQVPKPQTQREIARILCSLDDKIELNRQINQTLEQIAQNIFKSWFVDFEPVKAKIEAKAAGRDPERAAMCAISGKLDPELDQLPPEQYQQLAATAALFPDELVESELGLIPVGWEVKRIKDVIKRFSVGKKYSQKTASATGLVPILDQGKSGVIGFHNNQPGVEASPDDPIIVFANHTCYMRLIMHDFSAIQNVLPFKGVDLNIFWLYAATIGKQEFIEYKGHWPDFEIKGIAIPPGKLSQSYGAYVNEIYREFFANDCQSATLVELRDTLLPKLLSGEIELNQAV